MQKPMINIHQLYNSSKASYIYKKIEILSIFLKNKIITLQNITLTIVYDSN